MSAVGDQVEPEAKHEPLAGWMKRKVSFHVTGCHIGSRGSPRGESRAQVMVAGERQGGRQTADSRGLEESMDTRRGGERSRSGGNDSPAAATRRSQAAAAPGSRSHAPHALTDCLNPRFRCDFVPHPGPCPSSSLFPVA